MNFILYNHIMYYTCILCIYMFLGTCFGNYGENNTLLPGTYQQHPPVSVQMEEEEGGQLHFLDVLIMKKGT